MELKLHDTAVHSLSPEEVVRRFQTDAATGLSRSEAGSRLDRFGRNELPSAPPPRPLYIFASQFRSTLVIILLVAAAVALAIWLVQREERLPYDTIVILAIVVANAVLGFLQEFRAEKSLEKLKSLTGPHAKVWRDSHQIQVEASELVPGDVLVLAAGDSVLADARLIDNRSLEADESALTGESTEVGKNVEPVPEDTELGDRASMVFAATTVVGGKGRAVVTATGTGTEIGRIAELIRTAEQPQTPLQISLRQLGRRLGVLVLILAAVISAIGLLISGSFDLDNVLNMLLFGVALAVAAIPEGLPAVVTGALALGTQRMAHRNAIVRKLPAVETLGATDVICSDKTGTLTLGQMTVRELLLPDGRVTFTGGGYDPRGEVEGDHETIEAAARLAITAALCNDASLVEKEEGMWNIVGTPTEASLLAMAAKLGVDYSWLRQQSRRSSEEPFSSERKMMSVVASAGGGGGVLHAKGAPEVILSLSTSFAAGGQIRPLAEADRARQLKAAEEMASQGLRTLAFAYRQVDPAACTEAAACEQDLVFIGIAGIADPPRPEAAASIRKCRDAGIEVFMVTGDHAVTAAAIARELAIEGDTMTGREIESASDEELEQRLQTVRILARVSPGHKVRIVEALQRRGQTVAVTGDGVNDAPALRRADIGVAMGRSGTDVAREAADMVLADDNFATIVAAVEEGRAIFSNIRRFVTYLLATNAGEVLTLFLGVLLAAWLGLYSDGSLLLPLLAVQILWINLVTDGFPALALGIEPKQPDAMTRKPRPPGEPVINGMVLTWIAIVGSVSVLGTLFILDAYYEGGLFTLFQGHDIVYARTMAFVTLALFQLYDSFSCKRLRRSSLPHLFNSPWLPAAVALSLLVMVAVVHVPALQRALKTAPLAGVDWLVAAAVSGSVIVIMEIFKAIAWRER